MGQLRKVEFLGLCLVHSKLPLNSTIVSYCSWELRIMWQRLQMQLDVMLQEFSGERAPLETKLHRVEMVSELTWILSDSTCAEKRKGG